MTALVAIDCCQMGLDDRPGTRRQNLRRGHDDDDDVAAAVRQLAVREKGYEGCHNGGAAATAYSPSHIDARAVRRLTTMTMTTTTKIPGDPSLRPNCTAASRRRAPARAAPTIPWTGVLLTRRITCDAPPAGPRSCRRPRGRRPADSDDAFKGTARRRRRHSRRRCRRRQPPPEDAAVLLLLPPHRRRRPSSSSTSPSPA